MNLKKAIDKYDIEFNDGTQDIEQVEVYDINYTEPICPCCGKKLNFIDSLTNEYGQELNLVVVENTKSKKKRLLKENALSNYLLELCEEEAKTIYDNELQCYEPYTDDMGNILPEYNERFIYTDPKLKRVIKVHANALSNKLAKDGIEVDSYYLENEIIEILRYLGR